jgi:hypothetical protein
MEYYDQILGRKQEANSNNNHEPIFHPGGGGVGQTIDIKAGTVVKTPANGLDIVNKTYADGLIVGGHVQGTDQGLDTGGANASTAANVKLAVTAKHTQGSDTTLGVMTADIDMNSNYQIVHLQAPAASGEAIRATAKITEAKLEACDDHVADNTQAHSDYLLNSGTDIAVGPLTITADNGTADQAYVPMVLYNTDATPPAANTVPYGTIYIQYTA